MLNSNYDAQLSTTKIETRVHIYNSMWLNMHAVRPGENIAISGINMDTEKREEWFAHVEKFIKVGEKDGERTWDVLMIRYFEELEEDEWPNDIRKTFSRESKCRILKWHALGRRLEFVAPGHVLCKVDVSSISPTKKKGSELFVYNPWTTTTLFSKVPVSGHMLDAQIYS